MAIWKNSLSLRYRNKSQELFEDQALDFTEDKSVPNCHQHMNDVSANLHRDHTKFEFSDRKSVV